MSIINTFLPMLMNTWLDQTIHIICHSLWHMTIG